MSMADYTCLDIVRRTYEYLHSIDDKSLVIRALMYSANYSRFYVHRDTFIIVNFYKFIFLGMYVMFVERIFNNCKLETNIRIESAIEKIQ